MIVIAQVGDSKENQFICTLENNGKTGYGFPLYRYQIITPEPYTIFDGEQFKPSLSGVRDNVVMYLELIQWACLDYNNDDSSLFEDYTQDQLTFSKKSEFIELANADLDKAIKIAEDEGYIIDYRADNVLIIKFNAVSITLTVIKDLENEQY